MKYLATCLLALVLTAVACKKKSDPLPTTMTFVLGKDTLWTSTNVVTDNKGNGTLYVKGTSSDGKQSLDITLTGFNGTKKTFTVDYRGTGGNMTGNTGMYRDGSNAIMARAGKIVVTEVSNTVFKATYDLHYLQENFKGSFTAPMQ